jgi:signal transduction histidine kinase
LPAISADAGRLQACFTELAENAATWQPEGGTLVVRTTLAAEDGPRRLAELAGSGPFIRIDFEDGGPGVPSERKELIFRPFHSTRGRGMGLGLAICREVLQAHGGQIVEVGKPEAGAHFVLFLPVAQPKEQSNDV